jgi:hypothetical protein
MPNAEDGRTMLDLVWRGKVFRTRRVAMQACEDHVNGIDPALADARRKIEKKMKGAKLRRAAKRNSKKTVVDHIPAAIETPTATKKPRKPRADKGKPRGARRKRI